MKPLEEILQELANTDEPRKLFLDLPRGQRRTIYFQLPETYRQTLLEDLEKDELKNFIKSLDPAEAADVVEQLDETTRTEVLARLSESRRRAIEFLSGFDPDTAAGLMDLDFITVPAETSLEEISSRIRRHEKKFGRFPIILLLDGDALQGRLDPGVLSYKGEEKISLSNYTKKIPVINQSTSASRVIEIFQDEPGQIAAVIDDEVDVLGVIHAEDLLPVIREEAADTLLEFSGVHEEESVLDGPFIKIQRRYRWLILNLATAFLAAGTVGLFEETISGLTLLAIYMPIVAGMGGNAGTQSMAVTVRGIAMSQVSLSSGIRVIFNEIIAGAANGAITGGIVAVIATVFNRSWMLGAVLGVSMVVNLIIAGFFGALIPLVLKQLNFDPATSATIFITTATDVLGFFVFLGLAGLLLF